MVNMTPDYQQTEVTASQRDAGLVHNVKAIIKEKMTNPFKISGNALMNISTRQTTHSLELVQAKEKGLDALERTEKTNAKKVVPVKLKTFVENTSKKTAIDQTKELFKEE